MTDIMSGERNEVIVPSISWISTASSAALAGATVKFADVVDPTICVDIAAVKKLVTTRTAVVVVVHLYGRPVEGLVELAEWLRERRILLVEDCAHAGKYQDTYSLMIIAYLPLFCTSLICICFNCLFHLYL